MAESSWPGAAPATVTEHQHELLWSAFSMDGLIGDPSLSDLVFGDSTGMHVKIRPDRYALVRGFVWTSGDTEFTVPISSNASGQARVDNVVLRLDKSTWTVATHVVEGTPGAGGPTVSRDEGPSGAWDAIIAVVTVANGAVTITAGNVEFRQSYIGDSPLIADLGPGTQQGRQHFLRYAPEQDVLEWRRPAGPVDLWRDSGEVLLSGASNFWQPSVDIAIRKINNTVYLRYSPVQRIGGNLSSGSASTLPGRIPSNMRASRDQYVTVRVSPGHSAAVVTIENASSPQTPGSIRLVTHPSLSNGDFVSGFTATWLVV